MNCDKYNKILKQYLPSKKNCRTFESTSFNLFCYHFKSTSQTPNSFYDNVLLNVNNNILINSNAYPANTY